MKIRKLYIKLLLSFFGVLIITEILILALFIATAGRTFRTYIDEQSLAKLLFFQETLQNQINSTPLISLEDNLTLTKTLTDYTSYFKGILWITDPHGEAILGSPPASLDYLRARKSRHHLGTNNVHLYHNARGPLQYYATIPLQKEKTTYTLHLYSEMIEKNNPDIIFLTGLLVIGALIAILIFPLAKTITRRIRNLNISALAFAEGELSRENGYCWP